MSIITAWQADDIKPLTWAAGQLDIAVSTAYRLAPTGAIPGVFKVGAQWRVSVPKFMAEVHGVSVQYDPPPLPPLAALAAGSITSRNASLRRCRRQGVASEGVPDGSCKFPVSLFEGMAVHP